MTDAAPAPKSNPDVGLVLSGGGARGAYEAGALAALLPHLDDRGERPGLLLGTSIGSLNACHLAATAHLPIEESVEKLVNYWLEMQFSDIIGPLVSPRELGRVLLYVGGLLGIPQARVPALLDTTRLPALLRRMIDFEQLHRNVDLELASVAVAATSYAMGDSVIFHEGPLGVSVESDPKRAIRYVPTRLDDTHVQSSASIPGAFPATKVTQPAAASGWYGDGGTRLNTPIKPTLKLGAKRVVIIGLNSSAPPATPQTSHPDIFDGLGTYLQALFADPLAQDVATLASGNREVELRHADGRRAPESAHERVPYIFVAPRDRLVVGQLAADTFKQHLTGIKATLRARDLVTIGHLLGAGTNAVRGEVFSLLFFATEFHLALMKLGRTDAEWWLHHQHDDGPWRYGDPPLPRPVGAPPPLPKRQRPRQRPRRAKAGAAA